MDAFAEGSLLAFLSVVPDPRSRHGRQHALAAVLGLTCCAILCGARGYTAIAQWAADQDITLMHRLGFTRRPPKMGGIRKVLIALDMAALEAALTRWAESLLGRSRGDEPSPPEPSPSTVRRPGAVPTASGRPCICSPSWPTSRA